LYVFITIEPFAIAINMVSNDNSFWLTAQHDAPNMQTLVKTAAGVRTGIVPNNNGPNILNKPFRKKLQHVPNHKPIRRYRVYDDDTNTIHQTHYDEASSVIGPIIRNMPVQTIQSNEYKKKRKYFNTIQDAQWHVDKIKKRSHIRNPLHRSLDSHITLRPPTRIFVKSNNIGSRRDNVTKNVEMRDKTQMAKFGQFAKAAYGRDKIVGDGFVLDEELSTKKTSVYHNELTGKTVISYRGTDPTSVPDLMVDLSIAQIFMNENTTERFKNAELLYGRAVSKYGGQDNIMLTGHSLGGAIALYVAELHNVESVTFNPGISAGSALHKRSENTAKQYIYRTNYDPVSIGALLSTDPNRVVFNMSQLGYDPHTVDNFTNDRKISVPEKETTSAVFDTLLADIVELSMSVITDDESSILPISELVNGLTDMSEIEARELGLDKLVDVLKSKNASNLQDMNNFADRIQSIKKTDFKTDSDGNPLGYGPPV
jgi:hypothetical protein